MKTRLLGTVALGALLAAGGTGSAYAGVANVLYDPTGAGLTPSEPNITKFLSNNQTGTDDARALLTQGAGSSVAFTENGILQLNNFQENVTIVGSTGLTTEYNIFIAFSGSGTLTENTPGNLGAGASGKFSTISYTLIGSPGPSNSLVTPTSTTDPTLGGLTPTQLVGGALPAGDIKLATGGTGPSSVSLTALGAPAASAILSLTQAGTSFFAAPPGINEVGATFSVTPGSTGTLFTLSAPNSSGVSTLLINSGDVNTDFSAVVPEPASLAVLGTGLVGIGGLVRRRRSKV